MRNKVQLIGNLGADPEVRRMISGKKMVKISIATTENYQNAEGEKIEETQWHNLVVWNKMADIAEKHLRKGNEVAIEGKLINKDYIDRDGNKRYIVEVVVNEILMLGSKKKK